MERIFMFKPSQFSQFRVTLVPLVIAAALVGGDSTVLRTLQKDKWTTEILLLTGAKLVYMEDLDQFGVFSYHYDGKDGFDAVDSAQMTVMAYQPHAISLIGYADYPF